MPLLQLGDRGSNLTEEELETHTISAWKQAKLFLNRQTNEHRSEFPSQLIQVTIFILQGVSCALSSILRI